MVSEGKIDRSIHFEASRFLFQLKKTYIFNELQRLVVGIKVKSVVNCFPRSNDRPNN